MTGELGKELVELITNQVVLTAFLGPKSATVAFVRSPMSTLHAIKHDHSNRGLMVCQGFCQTLGC